MEDQQDYFISIIDNKGYLMYSSEDFRITELEMLNLIKICLINGRSKIIGKKLLEIYKDSTKDRQDLTLERLNLIGIKNEERDKPTRTTGKKVKVQ